MYASQQSVDCALPPPPPPPLPGMHAHLLSSLHPCDMQEATGIPSSQQWLKHGSKALEDGRTLADTSIESDSVVYQLLRLKGGAGGGECQRRLASELVVGLVAVHACSCWSLLALQTAICPTQFLLPSTAFARQAPMRQHQPPRPHPA